MYIVHTAQNIRIVQLLTQAIKNLTPALNYAFSILTTSSAQPNDNVNPLPPWP
jgi:hypothetical protein